MRTGGHTISLSHSLPPPSGPARDHGGLRRWLLYGSGRLLGKPFLRALLEMEAAQWLEPEQLKARAEQKLSLLLAHAARHVPFYRDHYRKHGIEPEQLRTIEDLRVLPVLTKAKYRERGIDHFLADNVPEHRRLERATSGSSGEPFRFVIDRDVTPIIFASHLFYDSWFGFQPFDRYVRIVSPSAAVRPISNSAPLAFRYRQLLTRQLQTWYENRTQQRISVWKVDAEDAIDIWRRIEKFHPDFVLGYTSTLSTIADELLQRNVRLSRPLRGVITIAEQLTLMRRQLIARYFGTPIVNRYGLREFGSWSAQNCVASESSLHINTELVVCEILREDGLPAKGGEIGRVVLTDLHNYAMPFIRYVTGDLGVAGTSVCPCGRRFPLLEDLQGRSIECVRTPSGKVVSPTVLGHYLFVYHAHDEAIHDYQLIQDARDRIRLLVVPAAAWNEGYNKRLMATLATLLGNDVTCVVQTVPEIPLEGSGKRPIIKVNPQILSVA